MRLTVSKEAAKRYIEELDLVPGDFVQFYVQLYGQSHIPNYSLGASKTAPSQTDIHAISEGITFYFNESDRWFLAGYHLSVELANNEIQFVFNPIEE
jgi:uncharacterized protein YneR